MAEALKRCGSVAKSSGVSMNHVMSYAMGINESVQDASKVKLLAWLRIGANVRNMYRRKSVKYVVIHMVRETKSLIKWLKIS